MRLRLLVRVVFFFFPFETYGLRLEGGDQVPTDITPLPCQLPKP